AIDRHRDQEHRHLDDPVDADDVVHDIAYHAAGDEPSRPAGVQDVQVVRFFFGEQGGHHRVDHHLAGPVGDGKHDHGNGEAVVDSRGTVCLEDRVSAQLQRRRQNVHDDGENHEGAVTNTVRQHTAHDDNEAEAPQASAGDIA